MTKKPTHGGARPNSGPKPKHDETKETTSVRLTPTVRRFAEETGLNLGETLEATVRRTKAFKDWLKHQGLR